MVIKYDGFGYGLEIKWEWIEFKILLIFGSFEDVDVMNIRGVLR